MSNVTMTVILMHVGKNGPQNDYVEPEVKKKNQDPVQRNRAGIINSQKAAIKFYVNPAGLDDAF